MGFMIGSVLAAPFQDAPAPYEVRQEKERVGRTRKFNQGMMCAGFGVGTAGVGGVFWRIGRAVGPGVVKSVTSRLAPWLGLVGGALFLVGLGYGACSGYQIVGNQPSEPPDRNHFPIPPDPAPAGKMAQ